MRYGLVAAGLLIAACDSGSGPMENTPTYAAIPTYSEGSVASPSGSVPLNANLILNITQNGGAISGTAQLLGNLNNGATQIADTGTFVGTEAIGENPHVSITVTSNACPSVHETFSGSYDSAHKLLSMTGPIYVLNADCTVNLTYSLTVVLGPPPGPGV